MVETKKNLTLRLDAELADQVRLLAAIENRSMSDVVRAAIVEHVRRRRQDPEFRRLVDQTRARHEALLRQFSDHERQAPKERP